MSEPVVYHKSIPVALVSMLQAIAPVLTVVVSLQLVLAGYGRPFGEKSLMLALVAATLAAFLLQPPGNVSARLQVSQAEAAFRIVGRWMVLLAVLFALGYLTKFSHYFPRRIVLTWAIATPVLLVVVGLSLNVLLRRVLLASAIARRVVFAGFNESSQSLASRLDRHPELCMSVQGFFDDRSAERLGVGDSVRLLGNLRELADYVKREGVDVIFVALPMRHVQRVLQLLDDLRDTTASIYYVPDVFVMDLIQSRTTDIMGIPVVAMCETPFFGYRGVTKRLSDIALSTLALIALLPVMLLVAIAVKVTSRGPVMFRQRRYGLDGQEIVVYKFRTMCVMEDGQAIRQASRDDDRITPLGRILRRYSIDELPQLVNVLQGRMSLVGPRPHAVAHNEEYRKLIKGYMIRHKVPPGITGLAQVSGCRGETSKLEEMERRIQFDLEYLRNWSVWLDLYILWRTAISVFRDQKAY